MCKLMLNIQTKLFKFENVCWARKELQKSLNIWPLIRKQGLEKNPKLINVGPTSIPESRVGNLLSTGQFWSWYHRFSCNRPVVHTPLINYLVKLQCLQKQSLPRVKFGNKLLQDNYSANFAILLQIDGRQNQIGNFPCQTL